MPVRFQKHIIREHLRANPRWRYVFGDNVKRVGLGGQAKEMRGEPNAIGVVTKWGPSLMTTNFFGDYLECQKLLLADLDKVERELRNNRTVVWPLDGIGTGLAQLEQRAPMLFNLIDWWLDTMQATYGAEN
jgi:hypothetical protein